MKKIIIIIFCQVLVLACAHSQPLFTFENETVSPGETMCIEVSVSNFTDIVAMQMSFHWDPTVLQFNNVGAFNLPFLGNFSFGQGFVNQGDLLLSWYDGGGNSQSVPDGTMIFEMCFTVIGQPGDNTAITIDGDPTPIEVVSAAGGGTDVGLDQTGGSVNIIPAQSEAINIDISDDNAIVGEEACVEIAVSAFTDITQMQFDITWNPALLTFSGVGSFNVPGINLSDLDLSDANTGIIHLDWSAPAGLTLPDATALFQLCFTAAVNQAFITAVTLAPNPFVTNTTSGNTNIGINTGNGQVNYGLPPVPDLVINIGGTDIAQGLSFCVPVTVQEFNNMIGGFLSLEWDPAVLTFDTMHVIDLLNLNPQNFQANQATGDAVMIWDSGIPFGLTLPDNSILFELCFIASGAPGSSSTIAVSNFPLVTTFEDYQNNTINISSTYGNVNILPEIPPLDLDINEITALPGETVCLEVTAGSYTDILQLSAGISWDESLLQFVQVQDFGLSGLDNSGFDVSGIATGSLSFDWMSGSPQGLDIPAGTVLFEICFLVVANFDASAIVQFDNFVAEGIVITTNSNNNNLGLNTSTGAVNIVNDLIITDAVITDVNCTNAGNGAIDLSVAGGTMPYFFQWSNGMQTEDLTSLNSGNFFVTITDSSVPPKFVSGNYSVAGDFNAPIVFVLPAQEITCDISSVLLDGSFSSSGSLINYTWATDDGNILAGQGTSQALVNKPGTYIFAALNTLNGCFNEYTIEVEANLTAPVSSLIALDTINCANVIAELQGSITSGIMGYTFEWYSNDGNFIAGTTNGMNPQVDVATTYFLIGINNENGCRDTAAVTVLADFTPPVASVIVDGILQCNVTSLLINGAASSSGPEFQLQWNTFDGHFVCCENTLTPSVDAPGLYFLNITNTVNHCETMTSVMVLADPTTPIAVIQTPDTISCEQSTVILDASNSTTGSDFTLQWSTIDGLILNGQNSSVPTVGEAGTYQLIISYQQGLCQDTATIEVQENMNFPAVNAGTDLALNCNQSEVSPVANGSGISLWTTQDGQILSGEDTFTPVFGQEGTYVLTVTGDNGCIATDTLVVSLDINIPVAAAGLDIQLPCMSDQISLDATGTTTGAGFVYQWLTSDGTILSGGNGLNPVVGAGNYELVVVNTINGCADTDQVIVNEFILPEAASAGPDLIVCDETITISGNLPAGVTGIWTSASPLLIQDPLSATTTVSGLLPGNNILIWTLSTADCPDYSADLVALTLLTAPTAFDDVYNISGGDSILVMDVSSNDQLSGAATWEISQLSSPESGSLTYLGNGQFEFIAARGFVGKVDFLYVLCNTYCETAPCDTGFVRINILDPPIVADNDIVPNGITPNGDGLNDILIFSELANTPELYPEAELLIFNRWGDIVYQAKPYANDWNGNNADGQPLPQGTYYYVLRLSIVKSAYKRGDVTILR